jgi:hypothetical protein
VTDIWAYSCAQVELQVLPGSWEKVSTKAAKIATLPISLWGKMSLLRGYLRPKVLFQLAVAREQDQVLDKWHRLEMQVLRSNSELSQNDWSFINEGRMHPLNWGRLPPMEWDIDKRRLTILPTAMLALGTGEGLAYTLALHTPSGPLQPLAESVQRRWRLLGNKPVRIPGPGRSCRIQPRVRTVLDGDKDTIKRALEDGALACPLYTTKGQDRWSEEFGTQWRPLWTSVNQVTRKVRAPVSAFMWRLLNRTLPLATHQECIVCRAEKCSIEHIFSKCPRMVGAFTPNPLSTLMSPPHMVQKETILALWTIWKTYNWVAHNPDIRTSIVDLRGVAQDTMTLRCPELQNKDG